MGKKYVTTINYPKAVVSFILTIGYYICAMLILEKNSIISLDIKSIILFIMPFMVLSVIYIVLNKCIKDKNYITALILNFIMWSMHNFSIVYMFNNCDMNDLGAIGLYIVFVVVFFPLMILIGLYTYKSMKRLLYCIICIVVSIFLATFISVFFCKGGYDFRYLIGEFSIVAITHSIVQFSSIIIVTVVDVIIKIIQKVYIKK